VESVSSLNVHTDNRAFKAIGIAGLVAGTMDICSAFLIWGVRGISPARILRSVAAGWYGREAARAGGAKTAIIGLLSHFMIAFGAAAVFYLASTLLPILKRQAIIFGVLFGIAVFFFMQYVVLPLSRASAGSFSISDFNDQLQLLVHIICVGLPISLLVKRYSRS